MITTFDYTLWDASVTLSRWRLMYDTFGYQAYCRYPVPRGGDYSNYPPAATIRHEVYEFSGQDALVAQFDHWENVGGYYVQAGGFNHFRTFDLDVKTAADRLDAMMVQCGYRLLGGPIRLSGM